MFDSKLLITIATFTFFAYGTSARACQDPPMPSGKSRTTALEETRQLGGGQVEVSTTFHDNRYGATPGNPGQGMVRYKCTKTNGCYSNCQTQEVKEFGNGNPKLKEKAELIDCAQAGDPKCRDKYLRGVVREGGFFGQ